MATNDIILIQQVSSGSVERTFNPVTSAGYIPVYTATGLGNSTLKETGTLLEQPGPLSATTIRSASAIYDGIGDLRTSPQNSQTSDYTLVFSDAGKHILYPSSATVTTLSSLPLYEWGRNAQGQLGQNDIVPRSSPVQVGSSTDWNEIATSSVTSGEGFTIATKTDGTLWSWGYNFYGQLGSGTTISRSSPVQVGLLTNWNKVAYGQNHTLAIKTDGTLWAWGRNSNGQLGTGGGTVSSPVQVGALTNWNVIAAGQVHSAAVKTDGTLWTWGRNNSGQLGIGDKVDKASPNQVGALTDWLNVACGQYHNIAVKTDGTIWTWGADGFGQLGLGALQYRSSPVQVGALTTWSKVACGFRHTIATQTNGTIWTWGRNNSGQLGLNNRIDVSSPNQVGALTNWLNIASGQYHTITTKTDGTLWIWGRNDNGQLGYGDIVYRSSPVQVGALTTWSKIAGGGAHTVATTRTVTTPTTTFSIPSNTTTPWPVGTTLTFVNANSAYNVSLSAADTMRLTTTRSTGTRTLSAYGSATALKTSQTEWFISGNGLT